MQTGKCPTCRSDVIIDGEAYKGDLVTCANCGTELEIISLHPAQLRTMENEEEKTRKQS